MGKLYTCLKKFTHNLIVFYQTKHCSNQQTYTSLDSPAHKEYKNLYLVPVEKTRQKLQALIHNDVYRDFFDEAYFVSGHTDRYWDKLLHD